MKYKPIPAFFRYTLHQRHSQFALLFMVFLLALTYLYIHYFPPQTSYVILPLEKEEITKPGMQLWDSHFPSTFHEKATRRIYANHVTLDELLQAGVPNRVAGNWIKYLNKGGNIRSLKDLRKIYGMDPTLLDKLAPHLVFEQEHIVERTASHELLQRPNLPTSPIDPNSAGVRELAAVGLPLKIAYTLDNYRKKGGRFSKPADLTRVYGLKDSMLQRILPFLVFEKEEPDPATNSENDELNKIPATALPLDLNQADTTSLKTLPGIGPVLARRIVSFRDALGGFHETEQLKEVYGLPDSTYRLIASRLAVSPINRPIRIHQDLPLKKPHPYLNVKESRVLANYIMQHGPLTRSEDLYRIQAFDSAFWKKLLPYLDFGTQ